MNTLRYMQQYLSCGWLWIFVWCMLARLIAICFHVMILFHGGEHAKALCILALIIQQPILFSSFPSSINRIYVVVVVVDVRCELWEGKKLLSARKNVYFTLLSCINSWHRGTHMRASWRIINLFLWDKVDVRNIVPSLSGEREQENYALLKTKQISPQFYSKFSLERIKARVRVFCGCLFQRSGIIIFQGWVSFDFSVSSLKVNREFIGTFLVPRCQTPNLFQL